MSWSVSATGLPGNVKSELEKQFAYPLADAPAGLTDEGERETVRRIRDTISQILETFAPERELSVSASGHISFSDWDSKAGCSQTVLLSIVPR